MGDEETLVSRRPRRSTAGNRMELAMAELAVEEPHELEEDVDYIVDKEEEDVFESDFASTDEEAAQEGAQEGDRTAQEEERRERKTARTRVERATAAAHARQRVTFNPEATSSRPRPQQKPKRRVSLGVVINAETGEVIEGTTGAKRQSQRRHTIMNTSATVNRIKDAEVKRAAIPKKTKTVTRLPTQDELIARALDTEEGNIIEHRNYLLIEEEKRAKARVVKKAIEGPVLRWISKKEAIQVEVQIPPPPTVATTSANMYASKYNFVYTPGVGSGSQAYSMPFYAYTPLATHASGPKPQDASVPANTSSSGNPPPFSTTALTTPTSLVTTPTLLPPQKSSSVQDLTLSGSQSQTQQPAAQTQMFSTSQPQPLPMPFSYSSMLNPPIIAHRTEEVCKNYVIHEVSQFVPSKPPWKDTMSAMFGDHVRWDEVKVFTGKARPLARPIRSCLVTGLPAKYLDPRTNVPFFDVGSYNVLTDLFGRGYPWSSTLGCYVGPTKMRPEVLGPPGKNTESVMDTGATSTAARETVVSGNESRGGDVDGVVEVEEPSMKRRKVEVPEG